MDLCHNENIYILTQLYCEYQLSTINKLIKCNTVIMRILFIQKNVYNKYTINLHIFLEYLQQTKTMKVLTKICSDRFVQNIRTKQID